MVHGQARVRGARIPVSVILDCLAAGLSEADILGQFPTLTVEGVRAAAAYGAALAREEIHPLPRDLLDEIDRDPTSIFWG